MDLKFIKKRSSRLFVTLFSLAMPGVSFSFLWRTVGAGGAYGQFMIYAAVAGYLGGRTQGVFFGVAYFPLGLFLTQFVQTPGANLLVNNLITAIFLAISGGSMGYLSDLKKKLKATSKQLRLAEEGGKVGLWVVDDLIYKTGNCSESYYRLFDLPPKPGLPTRTEWFSRIHPSDHKKVEDDLARALATGGRYNSLYRIIWRDQSIHWIEAKGTVTLGPDGKPSSLMGVVIDATESKEAQLLLEKQRVAMIETSKLVALGEMSGGIAHEINNPLAIILGKAIQLNKSIRNGKFSAEQGTEQLEKIISATERIAKIIRGLRLISRNGEKDPLVSVKIKDLMSDVLGLCSERFVQSGISLEVKTLPEISILCRPVQIAQVLTNLLNNAFDAVSSLQERWVRVGVELQGTTIHIVVLDSGHGIPTQIADKLMQPFFTTKEVGKGTGLGLSISNGIIADHGGRLWLDRSSLNTRFVIELPQPNSDKSYKAA
mgnify:CR=1 FL=1